MISLFRSDTQIIVFATHFKVAAYVICKSKDKGHFCLNAQLHFKTTKIFTLKFRHFCHKMEKPNAKFQVQVMKQLLVQ